MNNNDRVYAVYAHCTPNVKKLGANITNLQKRNVQNAEVIIFLRYQQ